MIIGEITMKQLSFILVLLCTFILAGCGSKKYIVTTKQGDTYIAKGDPDYDVHSETYSFKNEQGIKIRLNQSEIEGIQEK